MGMIRAFTNGRLCVNGRLVEDQLLISTNSDLIVAPTDAVPDEVIDLEGKIISPGFLELQTNGVLGFHFTHHENDEQYLAQLRKVSAYFVSKGVTGFWATVPTVSSTDFKKPRALLTQHHEQILPSLAPRSFSLGAGLLGAHAEGPYLAHSKRGAHNETLFLSPNTSSLASTYGPQNLITSIKFLTLAPELPDSNNLISTLSTDYKIVTSLGHSAADYPTGLAALEAGARSLTHIFNAMNPLHHRNPGLAGLISSTAAPYFSVIPDGIHLHPATLTVAFRANPDRCILITDSIELAGLPDGIYPGHAQIPGPQRKEGNKVTIDGTDTLIGSCCSLDECVRNLVQWSGCTLAQAVKCVTENIAGLMGEGDRGVLEAGRRADFVILDDRGIVLQTWIGGKKVYDGP
ncbi:MAG: hypothetical protein M1812_004194 [Candelaria pacifica]|nr:MAG: hypothetical protein M1812_004194 [Candelaria pacifica]